MKIIFNKIELRNFLSYKEATLEFNQKGFIQVVGKNKTVEDGFESLKSPGSNGAGKSSIFSAIVWVLTGQTASGVKDVQNIFTDESCEVTLDFNLDDKHLIVKRTKSPSKLEVVVNGENVSGKGIRDSEIILEKYLGLVNSHVINSVIVLGQGLPYRLTNYSPSGRKEVLEKLSNSDFMIEDLKTRVTNRESILKEEKQNLENKLISLKAGEEIKNNLINQLTIKLSDLEKLDLDELNKVVYKNSQVILSNNQTLAKLSEGFDELERQRENVQIELNKLLSQKVELIDLSKLNEALVEKRTLLTSKQAELKRLSEIRTVCPTCNQTLPHTHKPDTTPLREEIEKITKDGKELRKEFDKLNLENENRTKVFEENVRKDKLELNNHLSGITKEIQEKRLLSTNLQNEVNKLVLENSNLTNQINNFEKESAFIKKEITQLKEELISIKKEKGIIEKEVDEKLNSLGVITKMQTLLKRDFRGILLQNVLDYLQERLDDYSMRVNKTKKLKIELDGNNLNIKYNTKVYESLSGGEKTKVDIMLQLAIRDLLINQFSFNSNILVIDEITDFLDEKSAESIYNLFSSINVDSIFIISHRKDFNFPVDNQLVVVKEDNFSRIEN